MRKSRKLWIAGLALGWILFGMTTCSTKRVYVLVNPPDLATVPPCFWEQYAAMMGGAPGPFPCVKDFIDDAFQKDCETDDMFQRKTSQIRKCANYRGE